MGGRVDTVCFDKTGTITEDGMELAGVHPCITGIFCKSAF